ncbi:FAD-dependent oxidoreductase [Brevundimonas sp.]|uniref:GMC family oxidoreductase n=1 Tax=Brevundimonas sp. TaxID=1871086 RepID=UPI0026309D72|nr:FAD-dependent oxidoreductase [Brevundimonas sp.]
MTSCDAGQLSEEFDFIVVGGGSAGCAAANRLVTRHGATVLLLEAGPDKQSPLAVIPAGTVKMWRGQTGYVGRFHSEPQTGLDGRIVPLEHGSVLGGGSSINMMAYMRGSRDDYAGWSEAAGAGWGWEDLLPYFREQEGNQRFDNESHGGDGPLKVSSPVYRSELSHRFARAMQRMGVPFRADLTDGYLGGVGYSQCTIDGVKRSSAVEAFIDPIRRDNRLRLVTRAFVTRINFQGRAAIGVDYLVDGALRRATARQEVVLTAGAYVTPKLLMLSGIGEASALETLGIPVLADRPGVGRNLQDHHYSVVSAPAPAGSGFYAQDRGFAMIVNGLRYLLFKDGPAAVSGSESMAFLPFEPSSGEVEFQLYCMALMHPTVPAELQTHGLTLLVNLLAPRARGTISLQSADPADTPMIDLGWLVDEEDRQAMLRAFRYARRVLAQPPLSDVLGEEVWPGVKVQSDDDLLAHIRKTLVSNHHPGGTCRMGRPEAPDSVVDARLRVLGVDRLRVMDASMMPVLIRAGTNATAMAVAARGVDLMMAEVANRSPTETFTIHAN